MALTSLTEALFFDDASALADRPNRLNGTMMSSESRTGDIMMTSLLKGRWAVLRSLMLARFT